MKRLFLLVGLLTTILFATSGQQAQTPLAKTASAGGGKAKGALLPITSLTEDQKSIEVKFPIGDDNWETKWKIEWDMVTLADANKAGIFVAKNRAEDAPVLFKITRAFFKPGRNAPWVQVLSDAHPSEFYVPYYFRNTRFFDLRDAGEYVLLDPKEGGPRGNTLGKDRRVMAEVRDRGIAYKNGTMWRRAEEFTLWANFNAGNYTYVIEYGFMDDGTIAFRHAPTGYNLPSEHFTAHMHNCCWRIGIALGLENQKIVNTAAVAKWPGNAPHGPNAKLETANFGIDPIKTEGFRDWVPTEFTKIRVTNPNVTLNDPNGPVARPISYDLVTTVTGIARHPRSDESFSKHDFWITRADSPVKAYIQLGEHFAKNKGRALDGGPLVLWHMSSALHVPRSEDGIVRGSSIDNGQALTTWTSVELRPRHLFASTPIYRVPK
jgi:Copper amine oxidase, enzyme domain